MRKKTLFSLMAILFMSVAVFAGNAAKLQPQTFAYSTKGNQTLYLDKYTVSNSNKNPKPCVIFIFGGGFHCGERNNPLYANYFNDLVSQGYVVVSIDYRLGMKVLADAKNPMGDVPMEKMAAMMGNSVHMAVQDLFDATRYVLNHAKAWNIDKNEIMVSGSSAGAITALQGEYMICNKMVDKSLPENFNYSGLIAFAGAIFGQDGNVGWISNPCPMLLFHGDADRNVPFDKIEMGGVGLYGSNVVAGSLAKLKTPFTFYKVINANHEMASSPMKDYLPQINEFIKNMVIGKKKLETTVELRDLNRADVNKKFNMMDFIDSNFPSKNK